MKLSINNESVIALREYANTIPKVAQNIVDEMEALLSVYGNVRENTGPHAEQFEEMLMLINQFQSNSYDAVQELPRMLNDTADKMESYLVKTSFLSGAAIGFLGSIIIALNKEKVMYNPVKICSKERTEDEIIADLCGGDITEGSCSSLAFAFIGNRAGYYVLDFRGGKSCAIFSERSSIEKIAKLDGVESRIMSGKNDIECANALLQSMNPNEEYYLATGQHAAIVRKIDEHYEYLELQHPSNGNGWHSLDNSILINRFACSQARTVESKNYLISVQSLSNSKSFIDTLGYINTAADEQMKGVHGDVR